MPPAPPADTTSYCLTLGNGQTWRLRPVGSEAAGAVERLAVVMTLVPCSKGEEILVHVQEGARLLPALFKDPAPRVCILPQGENEAMGIIQMTRCAATIAHYLLPFGGLLIHGALVEKDGYGIILAGPGGVGKSTACCRIPSPWHALSDDAALVVDDGHGGYLAHPWPTWSRFFDNGPGGTWDVGKAVPLKALFFLHQSADEGTEPLHMTQSTAWVVESTHQVMGPHMRLQQDLSDAKEIYSLEIRAAERLVRSVPVLLLHISLTGTFWEEIEKALSGMASPSSREGTDLPKKEEHLPSPSVSSRIFSPGHIPILYTGPSMNPVLFEKDLLDVLPYKNHNPRVGDVICFRNPGQLVVHRVVGIGPEGILTQGDNNPVPDTDLQHPDTILGRVVAASRGRMNRNIHGGDYGRIIHRYVRIRKRVIGTGGVLIKIARPVLITVRTTINRAAPGMNPRIILFASRNIRILRLYVGSRLAGEYHSRKKSWSIVFPYQLIIDTHTLPTVDPPSWPPRQSPQTENIQSAR